MPKNKKQDTSDSDSGPDDVCIEQIGSTIYGLKITVYILAHSGEEKQNRIGKHDER